MNTDTHGLRFEKEMEKITGLKIGLVLNFKQAKLEWKLKYPCVSVFIRGLFFYPRKKTATSYR